MRNSKVSSKSATGSMSPAPIAPDAITLLTADHEKVKSLFEQYENMSDRAKAGKRKLATQICTELTKHAIAEEEIFYTAVRSAGKEMDALVDEAAVEHASAKELIGQIMAMDADDDLFDAKVKVLSEQIDHHVQEEEAEMFPKALKAKLDLVALGEAIQARKNEIELSPIH